VLPSLLSSWSWLSTPLDGVIHCEPRLADPVRGILERRQIPMVCVGRPVELRRDDYWADTRVELAVTGLLDHLADAGARRPALVVPDHDDSYPMIVRQACRDWEAARGIPVRLASFALEPNYAVAEQQAVDGLLGQPDRPDALVGVYTDSGTHILRAAERLGLAVPDDLKVACISEDPGYAWTDPPVTTVSLQPRLLSVEAVDLLLAVIDKRSGVRRWRLVDPTLHPRASTASFEGGAARTARSASVTTS
jgi:DNA-binding LacI/PurR family transcriptional regulator